MQMVAGDDDDSFLDEPEEETVGKTADQCSTSIPMKDGVAFRPFDDALDAGSHGREELLSQASTL
jgi:hypothetical protein